MKSLVLFLLIFGVSNIFAQEYLQHSLAVGSTAPSVVSGYVDSNNFKLLIFESGFKKIFVFLDDKNREVSRQTIESYFLNVLGFSSGKNEFVLFFNGLINSKKATYFIAFFYDPVKSPVLSEWTSKPNFGDDLIAYSFRDEFFLLQGKKKTNQVSLFRLKSLDSIKASTPMVIPGNLGRVIPKKVYAANQSGYFGDPELTPIYPTPSGLMYFIPSDESNTGAFSKIEINFDNGVFDKQEFQSRFRDLSRVAFARFDSSVFIYYLSPAKDENFFGIELWHLPTMKIVATYDNPKGSSEIPYKHGGLNYSLGQKLDEKESIPQDEMIGGRPWLGVSSIGSCFSVRLGARVREKSNVPNGPGSTIRFVNFHFTMIADGNLNPCTLADIQEPYDLMLKNFYTIKREKSYIKEAILLESPTEVSLVYYDKRAEAFRISSIKRTP